MNRIPQHFAVVSAILFALFSCQKITSPGTEKVNVSAAKDFLKSLKTASSQKEKKFFDSVTQNLDWNDAKLLNFNTNNNLLIVNLSNSDLASNNVNKVVFITDKNN